MLLDPLPLSQTVIPSRTPLTSSVTYFMDVPLRQKPAAFHLFGSLGLDFLSFSCYLVGSNHRYNNIYGSNHRNESAPVTKA